MAGLSVHSVIICTLNPAINGGAQCLLSSNMPVEEPFAVMHARCINLGGLSTVLTCYASHCIALCKADCGF